MPKPFTFPLISLSYSVSCGSSFAKLFTSVDIEYENIVLKYGFTLHDIFARVGWPPSFPFVSGDGTLEFRYRVFALDAKNDQVIPQYVTRARTVQSPGDHPFFSILQPVTKLLRKGVDSRSCKKVATYLKTNSRVRLLHEYLINLSRGKDSEE